MADVEKFETSQLVDPRAALARTDLPFSVDIVEARVAKPKFLASLNEPINAELRLSTDIT